MKLRNKKTGEIGYLYDHSLVQDIIIVYDVKGIVAKYNSLAELNEEWEDAPEEPKKFWFVDADGEVRETNYLSGNDKVSLRNFGNYFGTKEEAEQAVKKLKAWKRLNNCGLKSIDWWLSKDNHIIIGTNRQIFDIDEQGLREDLDLLFGGEE